MAPDITYGKRFRLSVVVEYESEEPLRKVDDAKAQEHLQAMLDYACSKFLEMPGDEPLPVHVIVERPTPERSVRELVASILRALERKGFDVT